MDVVILSEAFCHSATPILAQGFKDAGYKFETPPLQGHGGVSERKPLNGGVIVFSRYPIEWCKMVAFGEHSCGDDAMADKGVLYVKINKHNTPVHVFASHTQAWDTEPAKEVRYKQFHIIRDLIRDTRISASEPVIIAGDLNVNRYKSEDEYERMLKTLEAEDAFEISDPRFYSFDAVNNRLAAAGPSTDGNCALLDYILTSHKHLKPRSAAVEVFPVRAPEPYSFQNSSYMDLSDHYPVVGNFTFDVPDLRTDDSVDATVMDIDEFADSTRITSMNLPIQPSGTGNELPECMIRL